MTPIRIKPGVRALALTTTAFIALAGFAQQAQAATAANTVIRNQATATYSDAGGNSYQAQSNVAEITVQQVYSATISQDRTRPGAAGQTVYSSHTLTNLGNGDSYYAINIANVTHASVTGAGFTDIQVFRDLNGNGVADAGEPVVATTSGSNGPIRLSGSEAANLLIAARLPNGAVSGTTFGAMITATPVDSFGATGAFGRVTDTTPTAIAISDNDATIPGTNHLLTTVTSNAVLEVTKSATSTLVGGVYGVNYVVTVRNTGGRAAQNVRIVDALPANTVLVPTSVVSTGFGPTINVGDVLAAGSTTLDETSYGFDIDRDGDATGTGIEGVAGFDAELPAGATIQMSFSVTYNPVGSTAPFAAGDKITNIAYAVGNLDGVGGDEPNSPSNPAVVEAPPLRSVSIQDTGDEKGGPGSNDGGDDDENTGGGVNGYQTVDTAPLGATVLFDLVVQNNGNIADLYNLQVPTGHNFPTGTIFSFWNTTGTAQLLDTDGDGRPNTQTLAPGGSYIVQVRAILPQVATLNAPGVPYRAEVVASSSIEPLTVADSTQLNLLEISSAGVDLANVSGPWVGNVDAYDPAVDPSVVVPTTTQTINVGASATFPLFIHNHGGVADSFQLYAGGGWYAGAASVTSRMQALPAGWSVQFLTLTNQPITTTPAIQPGGTYELRAVVQAPNNYAQALTDYSGRFASTGATDSSEDRLTGGTHDGAYPIFFAVNSQNTGVSDVKLDAVKVNAQPRYELSADKDQQTIWPGGSSRTDHLLKNTGNTNGDYEFSTDSANPAWGATIMVDTNGDGQPDAPLSSLADGATVTIRNPDGTLTTATVDVSGTTRTIPLTPGQEIQVWLDVQAPTNLGADERNVVTLIATDGTTVQDAQVPYRVSLGVLRLTKSATVDNGWCSASASNPAPSADLAPASAFLEQGRLVRPGDCAIWQIVANNYGTESAYTINISDAVPDFTVYRDGTLSFCIGDAGQGVVANCSFAALPASAVNNGVAMTAGQEGISINLNGLPGLLVDTSPAALGSYIPSGASVTIRFATQVE